VSARNSQWTTQALTRTYLEGVRGAIPLAEAQIEVLLKIVQCWHADGQAPLCVLDLGCGDGILGRAVLDGYPNARAVFVDFSAPMLEAARTKLGASSRAEVIQANFSSPDWMSSLYIEDKGFDLVLSGFAIHHQTDERKRALYAELYGLLAPCGVFLNLEHVASPTPAVNALFSEYFIDHLHVHHRRSDPDVLRQEVAETCYNRPDKAENILVPVESQCAWLREIGFEDVDCFFKVFELALFGGRKPGAQSCRTHLRS
jgi:ubiquinone/menaquinone biosynthesis C-methylase UbiE